MLLCVYIVTLKNMNALICANNCVVQLLEVVYTARKRVAQSEAL